MIMVVNCSISSFAGIEYDTLSDDLWMRQKSESHANFRNEDAAAYY